MMTLSALLLKTVWLPLSAALRAFPAVQTVSYRRGHRISIGTSEESRRDFLTVVEHSPFREMQGRGLAADWALPRQTHKPGTAAFRTMAEIEKPPALNRFRKKDLFKAGGYLLSHNLAVLVGYNELTFFDNAVEGLVGKNIGFSVDEPQPGDGNSVSVKPVPPAVDFFPGVCDAASKSTNVSGIIFIVDGTVYLK